MPTDHVRVASRAAAKHRLARSRTPAAGLPDVSGTSRIPHSSVAARTAPEFPER